jgi:hypothetical protein
MGVYDILPKGSQVKCWSNDFRRINVGDYVIPLLKKRHYILLQEGGYVEVHATGRVLKIVEDKTPYTDADFGSRCFDKWGNRWSEESYKVDDSIPVYKGQLKSV